MRTPPLQVSPEIVRPPPDLVVDEGDSILIECVARGFPIPWIRWHQNGNPAPFNGSVLQITRVSSHHTGVYRCVAENVAGSASASALLAVRGQFVLFTFRLKSREGDRFSRLATIPLAFLDFFFHKCFLDKVKVFAIIFKDDGTL